MHLVRNISASALVAALLFMPGCGASSDAGQSTIGRQARSVAQESRQEGGPSYSIGPQYEDQMEQMISQEVAALGVEEGKEGVPMELNREVLLNINYFLNNARGFMTRSLSRGSKYIPMMKAIFRQKGLPEDLVYLALIESGFQTAAVSHASAVGPWQFIASTGRRYGLTINEYVDERMDPVKSTYAAADYLTTLHDMFNSWPLAIAAYNSGEGKILKGMKNYGVSNFWDMSDVSGHLAAETRLYVPSFLAATFIAKDPGAYGLKIDVQPPDQWDEAVVPAPISFAEAAKMAGTSTERLEELNPHLKKKSTPPDETDFVLRIPAGSLDRFAKAYEKSGRETRTAEATGIAPAGSEVLEYTIQPGDTKTGIALMSGQDWAEIAAMNKLNKNYKLKAGKKIKVAMAPRKKAASVVPPASAKASPTAARAKRTGSSGPRLSTITHKVQAGDTLGSISRLYGVPIDSIKSNNNMKSNTVYRGQILRIQSDLPLTAASPKSGRSQVMVVESKGAATASTATHTVVKGDTLSGIARKYGMSTKELADVNNIRGVTIKVGQKLKVRGTEKAAAPGGSSKASIHTVQKGESLGVIAQKYGISVKELSELNGLTGTNIKVGQKLKLKAEPKAAPPAKAAATATGTHIVAAGETMGGIAQKYKMTVKQLAEINGITGSNIRSGQKLKVSGPAETAAAPAAKEPEAKAAPRAEAGTGTHTVAAGETMYSIARQYKLSTDQLAALNPNVKDNNIRAGQKLSVSGQAAPKAGGPATHKVVEGDTLYSIAAKNKTSVEALQKLNGLKNNTLRLGQTLKLKPDAHASSPQ